MTYTMPIVSRARQVDQAERELAELREETAGEVIDAIDHAIRLLDCAADTERTMPDWRGALATLEAIRRELMQ
jgi:hypothetical protein